MGEKHLALGVLTEIFKRMFWVLLSTRSHLQRPPVAQMVKNPPAAGETWVRSLGFGRSPGEGHGNPLQCSCLENPMDRGAWRAAVRGVAKRWARPSDFHSTHCICGDMYLQVLHAECPSNAHKRSRWHAPNMSRHHGRVRWLQGTSPQHLCPARPTQWWRRQAGTRFGDRQLRRKEAMDELLSDWGGDCLYCVFIHSFVPQTRSLLWVWDGGTRGLCCICRRSGRLQLILLHLRYMAIPSTEAPFLLVCPFLIMTLPSR